ncbi:Os02g0679933 [Oryza sativa Japonica Group]|uniref:Os02g0679933 protein n=1 Tax=Oryza sativa subsp. japonica TaxID=39947 RepID=A0A0P0VMZ3_ORYSJ|nr:Os02g0679933 [Oryza sativa Japonica Group]
MERRRAVGGATLMTPLPPPPKLSSPAPLTSPSPLLALPLLPLGSPSSLRRSGGGGRPRGGRSGDGQRMAGGRRRRVGSMATSGRARRQRSKWSFSSSPPPPPPPETAEPPWRLRSSDKGRVSVRPSRPRWRGSRVGGAGEREREGAAEGEDDGRRAAATEGRGEARGFDPSSPAGGHRGEGRRTARRACAREIWLPPPQAPRVPSPAASHALSVAAREEASSSGRPVGDEAAHAG